MDSFSQATAPGRFMVDIFPARMSYCSFKRFQALLRLRGLGVKYVLWAPSKQIAAKWHEDMSGTVNSPIAFVND